LTKPIVFKFAGDNSSLKKSTKEASSELSKMGEKLKSSFSAGAILGPLAAAASFQSLVDGIMNTTKAYFEDQKSQTLLNKAIDNNTNSTGYQKQAIEDNIASLSRMSGVMDDDLRRSMSSLVTSTKSTGQAQKLLKIAMDVSAGSGKDLNAVTLALGKAYNGNYGALQKLLPGVSKSATAIDDLGRAFAGSAEAAGANDPYAQLAVTFDQLNETIGKQFAPMIKDFTAWLASPDGQGTITDFTDALSGAGISMQNLANSTQINGQSILTQGGLLGDLFKQTGADARAAAVDLQQVGISIAYLDHQLENSPKPDVKPPIVKKSGDIAKYLKDGAKLIIDAGKKWRDSVDISTGFNEDKTAFDSSKLMEKMRAVVTAAKALPAKLRALRKAGASPEMLQQIIAMGPQEGLVAATGFLSNAGSAKEYSQSMQTLNKLGSTAQANIAGSNTYAININKANMTAEEIIAAIQKYERKTGKKVSWNNG
jgi:hypothetical protein